MFYYKKYFSSCDGIPIGNKVVSAFTYEDNLLIFVKSVKQL